LQSSFARFSTGAVSIGEPRPIVRRMQYCLTRLCKSAQQSHERVRFMFCRPPG
jgi:hypothetical protein